MAFDVRNRVHRLNGLVPQVTRAMEKIVRSKNREGLVRDFKLLKRVKQMLVCGRSLWWLMGFHERELLMLSGQYR